MQYNTKSYRQLISNIKIYHYKTSLVDIEKVISYSRCLWYKHFVFRPKPRDWCKCFEPYIMYIVYALQMRCTKNSKQIFPKMKLHGLVPNFYIHGSVNDLQYTVYSKIGPQTKYSKIGGPIVEYINPSDTWMQKLGARPPSFISGNICFELSVQCVPYFVLLPCTGTGDGEYRGVSKFHYPPLRTCIQSIPINDPLIMFIIFCLGDEIRMDA